MNDLPRNNDRPFVEDHECKFCMNEFNFQHTKSFSSYITNSKFLLLYTPNNKLPPCKIKNVIYLITCQNCNIQYVGKTEQCLGQRA